MMGSRDEIEEETPVRMVEPIEDKMYVAVGKDVKESEKTLAWALHNSGGRKICILHVHQPAQKIPMSNFFETCSHQHMFLFMLCYYCFFIIENILLIFHVL